MPGQTAFVLIVMGLGDWLFAVHENTRLRAELSSVQDELTDARTTLSREIDANRSRETVLTEIAAKTQIPSHHQIEARPESAEEPTMITIEGEGLTPADVKEIAQAFAKAAAERGEPYSPEQMELLEARVAADPQEYLT